MHREGRKIKTLGGMPASMFDAKVWGELVVARGVEVFSELGTIDPILHIAAISGDEIVFRMVDLYDDFACEEAKARFMEWVPRYLASTNAVAALLVSEAWTYIDERREFEACSDDRDALLKYAEQVKSTGSKKETLIFNFETPLVANTVVLDIERDGDGAKLSLPEWSSLGDSEKVMSGCTLFDRTLHAYC